MANRIIHIPGQTDESKKPPPETLLFSVNFAVVTKGHEAMAVSEICDLTHMAEGETQTPPVAVLRRKLGNNFSKRPEEIRSFFEMMGRQMHDLAFGQKEEG